MKEIPITRGLTALVDNEDFEALTAWKWQASPRDRPNGQIFYATRKGGRESNARKVTTVYMHRQILGVVGRSIRVDHANGNSLDNRRVNLRLATPSQNSGNIRLVRSNTGYKGVSFNGARFNVKLCDKHVGNFRTAEEAAAAYDKAAIAKWGAFAATNAALGLLPSHSV